MGFRIKEKHLLQLKKNFHYSISREWLLDFIEAESGFIGKDKKPPIFEITQHSSDASLFYAIQKHFGAGSVRINTRKDGRSCVIYTLRGKENL